MKYIIAAISLVFLVGCQDFIPTKEISLTPTRCPELSEGTLVSDWWYISHMFSRNRAYHTCEWSETSISTCPGEDPAYTVKYDFIDKELECRWAFDVDDVEDLNDYLDQN